MSFNFENFVDIEDDWLEQIWGRWTEKSFSHTKFQLQNWPICVTFTPLSFILCSSQVLPISDAPLCLWVFTCTVPCVWCALPCAFHLANSYAFFFFISSQILLCQRSFSYPLMSLSYLVVFMLPLFTVLMTITF